MKIDTDELVDGFVGWLYAGKQHIANITLLEVGVALITIGGVLALNALYEDWKKKKGYRMAVRERTTKETELLTSIINDGLFEAECANKISNQRVRALYAEVSKKLNLPDLVPKQHRLSHLKEELKRKRIHEGKLDPKTWNKTTFSEVVGGFANKFWKK